MAFTQVESAGISSAAPLVLSNVSISGVITASSSILDSLNVGSGQVTISSGIITATTASISSNLRVGTAVTISSGIITATSYFASNNRRVVALTSGDTTLWYQAAAPTGWTKQTTHNDKALRVVSGTGGGSGGSTAFSTVMASRTPGGSVTMTNASFTLTTTEIPSHGHSVFVNSFAGDRQIAAGPLGADGDKYSFSDSGNDASTSNTLRATGTGSGSSHTHNNTASFTGTAMDFAVQYVDMIICSID